MLLPCKWHTGLNCLVPVTLSANSWTSFNGLLPVSVYGEPDFSVTGVIVTRPVGCAKDNTA